MPRNLFLWSAMVVLTACAAAPEKLPQTIASSSSSPFSMATAKGEHRGAGCFPGSCGIPPMTDEQLKKTLTPEQYEIMRQKGTEVPFTSPLVDEHRAGTFVAADTGEPLFRSEAKFESGTGWPSFFQPITEEAVILKEDLSHGSRRIEVLTRNGSHLGHVFEDGPNPTGLRYCINGAALSFVPDQQ